jgi:SAM-dependent methyltransferase
LDFHHIATDQKDTVPQRIPKNEPRTFDQLEEHYLIEKQLADRLRKAGQEERRFLYAHLYDELYRRVSLHPQLTRKADPKARALEVSQRISLLGPFLTRDCTFLEVGPGDCALALEVAKLVKRVYAVDVSQKITRGVRFPENFELVISDGCSIPASNNTVHVAYSAQLMEHLHPDDAVEQLRNIYNALTAGGVYVCITPNRLFGPHDISKYFDDTATGFHLKEYTISELASVFETAGFKRIQILIGIGNRYRLLPASSLLWTEALVGKVPRSIWRRLVRREPFSSLLDIKLVATKTERAC